MHRFLFDREETNEVSIVVMTKTNLVKVSFTKNCTTVIQVYGSFPSSLEKLPRNKKMYLFKAPTRLNVICRVSA